MMEVRLVDHMGSDLSVVNAARVSFAKESEWDTIPDVGPLKGYLKLVMRNSLSILQNIITGALLVMHPCSFISRHLYSLQDN